MKEYIVVLKDGINFDDVWADIENPTLGLPHIPDRPVSIARERTMFPRLCEYELTDDEAEKLKNDPRILDVEEPVRNLPNVNPIRTAVQNPYAYGGNFNKQAGSNPGSYLYTGEYANSINWGLIAHSSQSNPFGVNTTGSTGLTTSSNYNYVADGSNVDVIINDTGIQVNHPEFTNNVGASRILNINWNSIATTLGITGIDWNSLSYNDTDGHGTNVAGIATGKTYGWAKNANVIPLYLSTAGLSSADPLDTFEMMIYWHQNKGNNNPTIVNMSWDLRVNLNPPYNTGTGYYAFITGGSYRGASILSGQSNSYYQSRGLISLTGNGIPLQGPPIGFPYSSTAYNAALAQVIDAGIVVCQSAGNNSFKIDIPSNTSPSGDYDNYCTIPALVSGNLYYHRGASPKDPRAMVVGALDTLTSTDGSNQKVGFSCAGPGVDVYAAGTFIMSAGSNTTSDTNAPYFLNPSFTEYKESGTSQASPQVAGICALFLQVNPTANSTQIKSWININASSNLYSTGNATTYTNDISLLGGNAKVIYNPYNSANNTSIAGPITITNVTVSNN